MLFCTCVLGRRLKHTYTGYYGIGDFYDINHGFVTSTKSTI